jgi:hypothetical protein
MTEAKSEPRGDPAGDDRDRQAFEAWTRTFQHVHLYPLERYSETYLAEDTHHAWIGWCAARMAARWPEIVR